MNKNEKFVTGLLTVVELVGVIGLTKIALKRNQDAYEAQMKCVDLEFKNLALDVENYHLKFENERLKKEVADLKADIEKYKENEVNRV